MQQPPSYYNGVGCVYQTHSYYILNRFFIPIQHPEIAIYAWHAFFVQHACKVNSDESYYTQCHGCNKYEWTSMDTSGNKWNSQK